MSAERVLEALERVDSGAVTLTHDPRPFAEWWNGYPIFKSSDGWTFCLFDDCGEWDYVDWAEAPSGERIEVEGCNHKDVWPCPCADDRLLFWRPEHPEYWGYPAWPDEPVDAVDLIMAPNPVLQWLKGRGTK